MGAWNTSLTLVPTNPGTRQDNTADRKTEATLNQLRFGVVFFYWGCQVPYAVRKDGERWITYNKDTGETKGKHSSREKAMSQMRLLYMVKGGGTPTKSK